MTSFLKVLNIIILVILAFYLFMLISIENKRIRTLNVKVSKKTISTIIIIFAFVSISLVLYTKYYLLIVCIMCYLIMILVALFGKKTNFVWLSQFAMIIFSIFGYISLNKYFAKKDFIIYLIVGLPFILNTLVIVSLRFTSKIRWIYWGFNILPTLMCLIYLFFNKHDISNIKSIRIFTLVITTIIFITSLIIKIVREKKNKEII